MKIRNIERSTKKEKDEQTRAAARDSIFSEAERCIANSNLETREAVVKFLKEKGVDCDNNNLSDDDAIKVSGLMELIDSIQESKKDESSTDKKIDDTILLQKKVANNEQEMLVSQSQDSAKENDKLSTSQQNNPSKKKAIIPAKRPSSQQSKKNKSKASPALTKEELKEIEEEAKKNAENLRKQGILSKKEVKDYETLEIERLKNGKLKKMEPLSNIPSGYKTEDVKGDGNCFYRAIARIVKGNENNYHDIRNSATEAVNDLLKRIKNFENLYDVHDNYQLSDLDESFVNEAFDGIPFMGIFRQASDYKGGDVKTIKNALDILAKIKQSLSADKEFGGAAELYFISVAIKRPLVIYNNDGTIAGYSPELKMFIDRNNISWLDDDDDTKVMAHRKDNHFQALVKK